MDVSTAPLKMREGEPWWEFDERKWKQAKNIFSEGFFAGASGEALLVKAVPNAAPVSREGVRRHMDALSGIDMPGVIVGFGAGVVAVRFADGCVSVSDGGIVAFSKRGAECSCEGAYRIVADSGGDMPVLVGALAREDWRRFLAWAVARGADRHVFVQGFLKSNDTGKALPFV